MNQQTVTYTDTHAGWQQRVKRELGATKLYAAKGYKYGSGAVSPAAINGKRSGTKSQGNLKRLQTAGFNRTQDSAWLNTSTNPNGQLLSSYPIPFKRINNNQRELKQTLGYMGDGTATNPSNPSTMMDQGHTRNCVYNMNMNGSEFPDVSDWNYSKALGTHDQGFLNNSFYSFGAQHTNIKENLFNRPQSQGVNSRSQVLNKTLQDVKYLNSLKNGSKKEDIILMNKVPNVVMNDYTKNISQSIFTPGIIPQKQPQTQTVKLNSLFGSPNKNHKQLYYESEKKGIKGQVFGKIGSKTLAFDYSEQPRAVSRGFQSKSQSNLRKAVQQDARLNSTFDVRFKQDSRGVSREKLVTLRSKYDTQVKHRMAMEDDVRSLKSTLTSIRDNLKRK